MIFLPILLKEETALLLLLPLVPLPLCLRLLLRSRRIQISFLPYP